MENEINLEPDKSTAKNNQKMLLVAGLSTIVTALIVCYVFLFWQKSSLELRETNNQQQQQLENLQYRKNMEIKKNGPSAYVVPKDTRSDEYDDEYDASETDLIALNEITIDWNKKLKKVEDGCEYDECYLVGKITNDDPDYKDKPFYLAVISELGYSYKHYVIMKNEDGSEYNEYAESDYGENNIPIVGVSDLPEEITYPNTNFRLKKYYSPSNFFSDLEIKKSIFFNRDLGDFFLTDNGCMVTKLPDQTAISYDLVIPFVSEDNPVIDITFSNGKENEEEYEYTEHSCATTCTLLQIVNESDLKPDERLELVGKTVNGDDVFKIKNSDDKYLKDLYNDENTMAYLSDDEHQNQMSKNKYSYDEFIKLNPYLYWKDPLGRWIEFKNSKFTFAAEMCKPVIYLYPEDKTVLGVKVSPNGGFTKTEPAYNGQWQVEASPDGKLINLADGNTYDSLLWEGIGLKYPVEDSGWVVGRGEVDQFFSEKLEILGLNEKEIFDFKEYWVSRLNEKPYYQISFLTKRQFDSLAPLEFSPLRPDTLIRVMMTAKGLDEYKSILPQALPENPVRKGFTAVEWGGALLK